MNKLSASIGWLWRHRWATLAAMCGAGFAALLWWLRRITYSPDPFLHGYLEVVSGLIVFVVAANALVRFHGTRDRLSLLLAIGFVLTGLLEMSSSLALFGAHSATDLPNRVPTNWMLGRTWLALVLVAGLWVERRLPATRDPGRELVGAFVAGAAMLYGITVFFLGIPPERAVRPDALLPRPWQLLPAALFAGAAWGYGKRLRADASPFDRTLCFAAALNALCHLAASQSEWLLDAPFEFAQGLKLLSYALVLGGALLDNARLFDQVRNMAVNDPLTGLANYRRFADALEIELFRGQRTGRNFAVLLLDMDGLKKINDRHGHLVGTRAIQRIAAVMQHNCRGMDTAARYGGDEFALILPEAGPDVAAAVAGRITEQMKSDEEEPPISASIGIAVFPEDGASTEELVGAADARLYRHKARWKKKPRMPREPVTV